MISESESRYYSHSHAPSGRAEFLSSHLKAVAKRASEYAKPLDLEDEARIAGFLHDLGKYGHLFQERLKGKERGIDHWSIGAWAALRQYKSFGVAPAMAIQGHHVGLQKVDRDSLCELNPEKLTRSHPLNLRLSEADIYTLLDRLKSDGLTLPEPPEESAYDLSSAGYVAAMLDMRMLFSTLVDADFVETEGHFRSKDGVNKCYRPDGPALQL